MVMIVTQHRKILRDYKAKIEAMEAQKEELSKRNVLEIENIRRPTSSYAQSLEPNKLITPSAIKKVNLVFEAQSTMMMI
uniref:Uncharacterized protein n=1 Tax=Romanomermis culicivorax TaxID=13658 RepID=A0A915K504_ROMCU